MGSFFRWFPHREEPGLRAVGKPDCNSPVLVTCNYTLTVARLLRRIKGLHLWLLVARSGGTNVWCAACGGLFTDHQVISAVKTSMLADKVRHRTVVLPPLAAPSMDRERIRRETGFHARFGPVRAQDIAAYLAAGMKKTEAMKRADFGLRHRLDMLVSMNFIVWLIAALIFAIFWPSQLIHATVLFWSIALVLYLFFPWVPGKNGWFKALTVAALFVGGYLTAGQLTAGHPFAYWPWMVGTTVLALAVGFDLAGIAGPVPSDAEAFIQQLGFTKLGFFFHEKALGTISFEPTRCKGCQTCSELCPVGVYQFDSLGRKTVLAEPQACFSCGACVKQCPQGALFLGS